LFVLEFFTQELAFLFKLGGIGYGMRFFWCNATYYKPYTNPNFPACSRNKTTTKKNFLPIVLSLLSAITQSRIQSTQAFLRTKQYVWV